MANDVVKSGYRAPEKPPRHLAAIAMVVHPVASAMLLSMSASGHWQALRCLGFGLWTDGALV